MYNIYHYLNNNKHYLFQCRLIHSIPTLISPLTPLFHMEPQKPPSIHRSPLYFPLNRSTSGSNTLNPGISIFSSHSTQFFPIFPIELIIPYAVKAPFSPNHDNIYPKNLHTTLSVSHSGKKEGGGKKRNGLVGE